MSCSRWTAADELLLVTDETAELNRSASFLNMIYEVKRQAIQQVFGGESVWVGGLLSCVVLVVLCSLRFETGRDRSVAAVLLPRSRMIPMTDLFVRFQSCQVVGSWSTGRRHFPTTSTRKIDATSMRAPLSTEVASERTS